MQQNLVYRDCPYMVGPATDRGREWAIFPDNGPPAGAAHGIARGEGLRGSFKVAVHTAQHAIDCWLDGPADRIAETLASSAERVEP